MTASNRPWAALGYVLLGLIFATALLAFVPVGAR